MGSELLDDGNPRLCSSHKACAQLAGPFCCPTPEGMRLSCCGNQVVSEAWAWMSLFTASTLIGVGLISFVLVLPRAPGKFRREVSVAITSGMVYLLMSLPLFLPRVWNWFPENLQDSYVWLPFWYAFVLTKYVGSFFEVATYSALGTLTAVFAMVFLNYLLPGGAGPFSKTALADHLSWTAWMGHGYKPYVAWIFSACFVYGVFLSRWATCMKQYALGFYASLIVGFMNPNSPYENFRAILWNYNFTWNWTGSVLCTVYITLGAIPLAALSLPVVPCYRRWRRFFSCRAMASKGLSKVAADTWGSLDRLITYFQEDSSHFDVESSFIYIRQLGTRRSILEELIVQAKWECINDTTIARLLGLERVCEVLKDLRQGLRVQLEQVRGIRDSPAQVYTAELAPHLAEFLEALGEGMSYLTSYPTLQRGLSQDDLRAILASATTADAALVEALLTVPRRHRRERIFVDCLRNFPAALTRFAKDALAEREADPRLKCRAFSYWDWMPHHVWCIREQHVHAVRNTSSWLLALFWSCMVRRATCVTTVSFIFSPSLGSLFDRNVNRILGVGIGLALGNLPAVMLLKQECYTDDCFIHYPQGPIVYLQLMFAQWALAMYGYLATGSKYSYACLLWAGFSGVQMLRSMYTPNGRQGTLSDSKLFESTMDNMLGCFIVFAVDILAAHLTDSRTTEQVATNLPQCFNNVSSILTKLRDGGCTKDATGDLAALKRSIEASRFWDEESRKEDFVWTTARLMPYKADLVDAVLRHMDDVYVGTWSLLVASERSAQQQTVQATIQEVIPECLASRCRTYGQVMNASLREMKGRKIKRVDTLASDPNYGRSLRIADSLDLEQEGGEEEGDEEEGGEPRVSASQEDLLRQMAGLSLTLQRFAFSEPVDGAPVLTAHADCLAIHKALRKMQALLEEHTFWAGKDWRPPTEEEDGLMMVTPCGSSRRHSSGGTTVRSTLTREAAGAEEDEEDLEDSSSVCTSSSSLAQSPCLVTQV